jgi:hypothetical protein
MSASVPQLPLVAIPRFSWVRHILEVFSMAVPDERGLFAFNREFIEELLPSLEIQTQLPILLAFSGCLTINCSTASVPELLRKLIAIATFAQDLMTANPSKFIDDLAEVMTTLKSPPETESDVPLELIGATVAHGLSVLVCHLAAINERDTNFRILRTALEYYLSLRVRSGTIVKDFFSYFLGHFFLFPSRESIDDEPFSLFCHLIGLINTTVLEPVDSEFGLVDLANWLFGRIGSSGYPLRVRNEFFTLLTTLASRLEEISMVVFDPRAAASVIRLIIDNLAEIGFHSSSRHAMCLPIMLSVSFSKRWDIEALVDLERVSEAREKVEADDPADYVRSFIPPWFDPEIGVLTESDKVITSVGFEAPASISEIPTVISLIHNISRFCRSVSLQTRRKIHIFLLSGFLTQPDVRNLEIFPFFIAYWAHHFIRNATVADVDALYDVGFFQTLLEESFLGDDNVELMEFCSSLLVDLLRSYPSEKLLGFLLEFFIQSMRCFALSPILANCVRVCAIVSCPQFIQASGKFLFTRKFARLILRLQNSEIAVTVRETMRLGLYFVELMRSLPDVFKVFFESLEFVHFVMSLFFDSSTAFIASCWISDILIQLQARSSMMQFIFKFIVTRLFHRVRCRSGH